MLHITANVLHLCPWTEVKQVRKPDNVTKLMSVAMNTFKEEELEWKEERSDRCNLNRTGGACTRLQERSQVSARDSFLVQEKEKQKQQRPGHHHSLSLAFDRPAL